MDSRAGLLAEEALGRDGHADATAGHVVVVAAMKALEDVGKLVGRNPGPVS